jgi:ATP-dependent Lon protease
VSGALGEPAAVQALREVLKHLAHLEDPEQLADLVSATLLPDARERQVILETRRLEERLRFLIVFLRHDIETRRNSQSE